MSIRSTFFNLTLSRPFLHGISCENMYTDTVMHNDPYYRESIVYPSCKHFRLRIGKKIVGYKQIKPHKKEYFSKDNFWWRSSPIDYQEEDRSSEVYDTNRQMIFEHDLIRKRRTKETRYTQNGVVEWDESKRHCVINFIEENEKRPLLIVSREAPFRNDLKVVNQLFP